MYCLAEKAIVANRHNGSKQWNNGKRIRLQDVSETAADVDQARTARPKLVNARHSGNHGSDAACGSDTHNFLVPCHYGHRTLWASVLIEPALRCKRYSDVDHQYGL